MKTTGLQIDRPSACTANQRWGYEIQRLVAWRMSSLVIPFLYVITVRQRLAALTMVHHWSLAPSPFGQHVVLERKAFGCAGLELAPCQRMG